MKSTLEKSPWFRCLNPKPDASFRLFCLPYAGAGASVFRQWDQVVCPEIELQAIQLPGREARLREPLLTSVGSVVDALVPDMADLLDKPFSIFGHSLGALIGFELVRRLQKLSLPIPDRLFVSARQAPQVALDGPGMHLLPEADFREELRCYAGTPEVVLQDNDMMRLLSPILRTDIAMNETYDYVPGFPIPCPISAFAGLKDSKVSVSSVKAWADQTSQEFKIYCFDGNHFFLKQHYVSMLGYIEKDLIKRSL